MKTFYNKIKINNVSILKCLIIINIILALFLTIFPIKTSVYSDNIKGRELYPSEKINNKRTYSQIFNCDVNYLNAIGIKLSTYEIQNKTGKINVSLKDESGKTIHTENINLKDVKDNDIYTIYFEKIKKSKNKNFIVDINYETYITGNSIAYWYTTQDLNKKIKINNKEKDQEMYIVFNGQSKDYSYVWYPLLMINILYAILIVLKGETHEKN